MATSQEVSQNANFITLLVCLITSITVVSARTAARWVKEHRFSAEDYFCWLGLASFISLVALYLTVLDVIYKIAELSAGNVQPSAQIINDGTRMMHHLFAIQLLFWLTLYSVKLSLLCLFRHLTLGVPYLQKLWWGVLIFTIVSFVGSVISELTSCIPLHTYFEFGKCSTSQDQRAQAASLYLSLAVDILTDLAIMVIPMRMLWDLHVVWMEKLYISLVMFVGVITMICAIVRASSLGAFAQAGQIPISWLAFWASIEGAVAILVNCLPAFAVFLRRKIRSLRTTGTSTTQSRTQDIHHSRQKGKIRSESILLHDVAPVEAGGRSESSHGGSDG